MKSLCPDSRRTAAGNRGGFPGSTGVAFFSGPDGRRASAREGGDDLGLLNEGFRRREPETGVFLSRGPAGFADGPNLYTCVRQNPWTRWDPQGLNRWGRTWKGEFSGEGTSRGGTGGQTAVGLIPIAGRMADLRDTAGAGRKRWRNPNRESALNFAPAMAARAPLAGDGVKGVVKAGQKAAGEGVQNVTKNPGETGLNAIEKSFSASPANPKRLPLKYEWPTGSNGVMRVEPVVAEKDLIDAAAKSGGCLAGSGPAVGVLEVSPLMKSTKAFQNYKPGAATEFVSIRRRIGSSLVMRLEPGLLTNGWQPRLAEITPWSEECSAEAAMAKY